jgi:hypothetical protein
VSGGGVAIAGAIKWPVVVAMIRLSAAAIGVAERCQICPSVGLALLNIGEK